MISSRVCSRTRAVLLVAVGAFVLLGHGQARAAEPGPFPSPAAVQVQEASPAITNEWCPVLTDEPVDPDVSTAYGGRTVFLCCRKCLQQFEADPQAYVANFPAGFFDGEPQDAHGGGPGDGHDEEHGHGDEAETTPVTSPELSEHDHAGHASGGSSGVAGLIQRIGRLHPMVVHFPIALLLASALAELLSVRKRSASFAFAARFCLWTGTLGAIIAAALGWADALGVEDSYSGFPATLLGYHRWAGTLTAGVALLALIVCEHACKHDDPSWRRMHRGALFLAALLVTVTGHLGASLIFGWDYFVR